MASQLLLFMEFMGGVRVVAWRRNDWAETECVRADQGGDDEFFRLSLGQFSRD